VSAPSIKVSEALFTFIDFVIYYNCFHSYPFGKYQPTLH
jgi:hypothetical protein